ncbi:MAG TPA: GDYXXLXY domain-containing protein [Nitrospirota bacterium]
MRKTLIIIAIAFQVLVLVFMTGKREYIAATGTVVYLRTAPIDPRDLFRGDYVRLKYEASVVPLVKASPDIAEQIKKNKVGETVYASLAVGESGLAEVTALSTIPPAAGLYLKGRLANSWRFGMAGHDTASIEYGIEAYYVQQGKGLEIEKQQGTRTTIQTPLEMEVAIGGDGTAMIRGYRWSPIGIGLEVLESPRRDDLLGRKSAKLRLTLKNTSQKPLAIVNLPNFCSLFMEPLSAGQKAMPQERPACAGLVPTDNDVLLLQPGEARFYDIDLVEQQWQVLVNSAFVESGPLDWNERFRLVYRPPSSEACSRLREAASIWHGQLPSRAFHGRGNID